MCLKPRITGYIYLTRTAAFRNSGEPIYKLGKSIEYVGRFNGYDKFSELYVLYYVEDIDVIENILLQIFNRKYKNEIAYGKEYYNGNVIDMLNTIKGMLDVYGLIHKVDLVEALFNDKLKRFIIYNSEEINADFYEMMNEIMIDKNVNIQINDISNYNNFYYEYIMNNKKIYNNGKNNNKIKTDIKKIPKIKTILENDCDKVNESKDEIKPIIEDIKNKVNENEFNQAEFNEEEDIKNEVNEEEDIKNGIKDRLLYICHHCIKYYTTNRKDLVIHFNRKHKCMKYHNGTNYEESKIFSLNKKFYFHFNIKDILIQDFDYITKNYNDKENHLYENYKENKKDINKKDINKKDINKKDINEKDINEKDINKKNINEEDINEEDINEEDINKKDINKKDINEKDINEKDINKKNINEEDINEEVINKKDITINKGYLYEEFQKKYYNFEKNKYICDRCKAEYKSKQSLLNHIYNNKRCDLNLKILNTFNKSI